MPLFTSLTEAVYTTLCPKRQDARYYNLACMQRQCNECGTSKFELAESEKSNTVVTWKRYEYIEVSDKRRPGEVQKKIALMGKETPASELFQYFLKLLGDYTYHSFMAKWQKEQFENLLANLPQNHVLCVHDFSDNYSCRYQHEIQLQFFDQNKISIHVSILYRHSNLIVDGEQSTVDDPLIVKEHVFVVSDDNTQDYNFVHEAQKLIFTYLTHTLKVAVDKVHEFTGFCAGQYKSRHTYGDLSCSLADFAFQVDRHFFETSHAKGEQDAAGANIKQRATLAVIRREATIGSAKDLYDYLTEHFTNPTSQSGQVTLKKRVLFHISPSRVKVQSQGTGLVAHLKCSMVLGRYTQYEPHLNSARSLQEKEAVLVLRAFKKTLLHARMQSWLTNG